MIIFLYIVVVLILIFIGLVLFKGYILLKDYNKRDKIIQPVQNNTTNNPNNNIPNQKHNLPSPKIILDNKVYSQQEFSKEISSKNFQMSSMLRSKLNEKDKNKINPRPTRNLRN